MTLPELWQFRFSMYPEKVRWALDHKRVPHIRRSLLPGPHAPLLLPRFGQKATPILCHDGRTLKHSAEILAYVEQTWPEPPLYPADPAQRGRALELCRWLDEEVGPALRRAAFHEFLPHTSYAARRIADGLSEWQQKLYVAAFPGIRAIMMLDMGINAASAEAGRAVTQQALDTVARESARTGYLAGDRFSVADLTAATILFPTCMPPEYPVALPEPLPEGWRRWLERWQGHAGCEYVRRMYREHRGVSAAVEG